MAMWKSKCTVHKNAVVLQKARDVAEARALLNEVQKRPHIFRQMTMKAPITRGRDRGLRASLRTTALTRESRVARI